MTTYGDVVKKCAICGEKSPQTVLTSTNRFGSPDLDLRPPEMERSTMDTWVEVCPHCGFVASDISKKGSVKADMLKTESYLTCDSIEFVNTKPETPASSGEDASEDAARQSWELKRMEYFGTLAQSFYRQYLLAMATGDKKQAWNALLHAAWCCDDFDKKDAARTCRLKLVPLLDAEIQACTVQNQKETLLVLRADVLRRAGEFDKVIQLYQNCQFEEKILNQIIQFQLQLARKKDTACYTVDMAMREN